MCLRRKVLWFIAIAAQRKETALEYYLFATAALQSAISNAPSLIPIVLHAEEFRNLPDKLSGLSTNGVHFVQHNLSFQHRIVKFGEKDNPWLYPHFLFNLGAYYRLDIPYVIDSVIASLSLSNNSRVDTDFVLYTDTDIMFLKDFDECSLPKPSVLMLGGEDIKGKMANTGVLYMNVSAMKQHFTSYLTFADDKKWNFFVADQTLIIDYFVRQQLSQLLPDEFNWKGYWGGYHKINQIVIVHFHAAKPRRCLDCFLQFRHHLRYCTNCTLYQPYFEKSLKADDAKLYEQILILFNKYSI